MCEYETTSYNLKYLDANSLNGQVTSQYLPTDDFKRGTDEVIEGSDVCKVRKKLLMKIS